MNEVTVRRIQRWLLPVWLAYAAIWVAWWTFRLTAGGGVGSAGEAASMVLSGISGALGLANGWWLRRS